MIASNGKVASDQRFTAARRCPICNGHEGMRRGQGERCTGFLSEDGTAAFCSRTESSKAVDSAAGPLWVHRLEERVAPPRPSAKGKGRKASRGHQTPLEAAESLQRWLRSKGNDPGEIAGTWYYRDRTGQSVLAVFRFERPDPETGDRIKTYRPVHRGDDDRWRSGDPEGPLPLYQLPTLAEADLVVITEGEKAADAVRSLGLVATTPAHGAKSPHLTDWSPLAGKQVVVLPDNDDPGREFAATVVKLLSALDPPPTVKVLELPGLPPKGDAVDWVEAGGTADELLALVESAEPIERRPGPGGIDRPEIEVNTEWHRVLEEASAALAGDPDLYVRGFNLVTVLEEAGDAVELGHGVRLRNARGAPKIQAVSASVLGCHLTRCASLYRWQPGKSGELESVDCAPPGWLVKAVHERKSWPKVRPLLAVAGSPFIRADGSIVSKPGYDRTTGTLYRPTIEFPPVPSHPSRRDAQQAAKRIHALVDQFPFASEEDKAVWMAGLLTMAARQAIRGPVPGIAVIGNRAGCGKGLLIDVPGIIVHGHNVPTSEYPGDKHEAQKVKVSIALDGKPVCHFDNLEEGQTYGNGAIDSMLTSSEIDDRILGTNQRTGRIPIRCCWWLSGNNVSPGKDAYRRWLPCNLSTRLERPEERKDIKIPDLRAYVTDRRGELLRDVLTILKAHAEAGYPNDGWPPLGSFEDWDRIVRGAVWFATGRDCCVTRRKAADEAPERLDKLALLEGWAELPDGRTCGHTVEHALRLIQESPERFATLRSAFTRRSRDGKLPTPRQIGNLIRGMKGAKFDKMAFEKAGERNRSACWIVTTDSPDSPDSKNLYESDESNESKSRPNVPARGADNYVNTNGHNMPAISQEPETHSLDSSDSLAPLDPDDDRTWTF